MPGNLLLHREDIAEVTIVAGGPDVAVRGRVDEIDRDPDAAADMAHGSLEDMPHPERVGDLPQSESGAFERPARGA